MTISYVSESMGINMFTNTGREEIAKKIRELNELEAQEICAHGSVEVVLDGYGRAMYEVCRSCGKHLGLTP